MKYDSCKLNTDGVVLNIEVYVTTDAPLSITLSSRVSPWPVKQVQTVFSLLTSKHFMNRKLFYNPAKFFAVERLEG